MPSIDVAKHWNDNADQWTQDVRAGFDVYRDHFTFPAFLGALPPINGYDVIDFGCGEGRWGGRRLIPSVSSSSAARYSSSAKTDGPQER